jgi:rhodanese-related sulfurtransferase
MVTTLSRTTFAMSVASLILLPACWSSTEDSTVKNLCSKQVFVINVLDKKFADNFSIAGSTNVPFDQIMSMTDADFEKRGWNKEDARLVVYCGNYACGASGAAAEYLTQAGFKNVYAYEGGSAEWLHLSKEDPHYKYTGAATDGYLQDWENKAEPGEAAADHGYKVITGQQLRQIIDECVAKP